MNFLKLLAFFRTPCPFSQRSCSVLTPSKHSLAWNYTNPSSQFFRSSSYLMWFINVCFFPKERDLHWCRFSFRMDARGLVPRLSAMLRTARSASAAEPRACRRRSGELRGSPGVAERGREPWGAGARQPAGSGAKTRCKRS